MIPFLLRNFVSLPKWYHFCRRFFTLFLKLVIFLLTIFDPFLDATAPPLERSPKVPLTPQTKITDRRNITVLFGTSITRSLDSYSLSNRETELINVYVSGARLQNTKWSKKIPDIATMVKDFAYSHSSRIQRVNRVVFSFGTKQEKTRTFP